MKSNNFALEEYIRSIKNAASEVQKIPALCMNALSVDGKIIGTGRSDYTREITGYSFKKGGQAFVLYDVPGIEGNESAFEDAIKDAVNKAHLVFYVSSDTKRIEPGTAKKIKKYLRNDTNVFSVINMQHMPKSKRCAEIDGTYSDEAKKQFDKDSNEIKPQTEKTLRQVLGENFKGGFLVNGLQAFSALAMDKKSGLSTVVLDSDDKKLRLTQSKFLAEYGGDAEKLYGESLVSQVERIIDGHTENFKAFIVESNKRKLISRIREAKEKVGGIGKNSDELCRQFSARYSEMSESVRRAKEDFVSFIKGGFIENSVENSVNELKGKLFDKIERLEGKLKEADYQSFFESNKDALENNIKKSLEDNYKNALEDFKDKVQKAEKRFGEDVSDIAKYAGVNFPELSDVDFSAVVSALNFSAKDFGSAALKTGSLALSGAGVGTLFAPIIGTAIGAAIGALVGVIFSVIGFLQGKEKRIAKAKDKAREILDDVQYDIVSGIKTEFKFENYVSQVSDFSAKMQNDCETEIAKFQKLENSLGTLTKLLNAKIKQLEAAEYGTL